MARQSLIALVTVGVLVSIFAVCLVSEGALIRDTVAHVEMSGSQELILRLNKAPHGALVEV